MPLSLNLDLSSLTIRLPLSTDPQAEAISINLLRLKLRSSTLRRVGVEPVAPALRHSAEEGCRPEQRIVGDAEGPVEPFSQSPTSPKRLAFSVTTGDAIAAAAVFFLLRTCLLVSAVYSTCLPTSSTCRLPFLPVWQTKGLAYLLPTTLLTTAYSLLTAYYLLLSTYCLVLTA